MRRHAFHIPTLTVTLTLATLCCALAAVAQPAPPPGGPGGPGGQRPTDKIAADLHVPEAAFIACFDAVRPDPNHAPDAQRQKDNEAVLLPCLQKSNPGLTNARLDKVMDRYRPEGPPPGAPRPRS